MEALVLIFAEIIFACLAPLLGLIGALIAAIFEAIGLFLSAVFATKAGTASAQRRKGARKPLVSRKVLHWCAGLIGGVGVLAVLATFVFFDPILRSVLTRAGDKAGIAVGYEESSGNLLFGRVALANLEMSRESEDGLAFALQVHRVEADVDLWSLLGSEPRIEFAAVEGVSGRITPPEAREDVAPPDVPKTRRPFRADRVQVDNVALQIEPRDSDPYALTIDQGEVAPFRSKSALFDLLFRSNLTAEVAGQLLRVETREISDQGRETLWEFDQVQVDQLRLVLPRAPLTWLDGGTVTVSVEDRWDLNDNEIDMDWRIELDGIDVSVPENASAAERLLAGGLARAVAAQGGDATFQYRLDLEPDQVAAMRAGDLDAFWDTVLSGLIPARFASAPEPNATDEEERGTLRRTFEVLRDKVKRDE